MFRTLFFPIFFILSTWTIILLYKWKTMRLFCNNDHVNSIKLKIATQELELLGEQSLSLQKAIVHLYDMENVQHPPKEKLSKFHVQSDQEHLNHRIKFVELLARKVLNQMKFNLEHLVIELHDIQLGSTKCKPLHAKYESILRHLRKSVREMWNFVRLRLNHSRSDILERGRKNFLWLVNDYKLTILSDLYMLQRSNNEIDDWESREAKLLSDTVQERLRYIQNPSNCSRAKIILCPFCTACKATCQMHHLIYCLIMAYATERTMVLTLEGKQNISAWSKFYQPLSDSCTTYTGPSDAWPANLETTKAILLPALELLVPRPPFLPPSIPKDLEYRLKRLHGLPIAWWIGQFLKYILRPRPDIKQTLENSAMNLNMFEVPLVGIYVHSEDLSGANHMKSLKFDDYMKHADEYYMILDKLGKVDKRRVFVAPETAELMAYVRKRYPNYEFLSVSRFISTIGHSLRVRLLELHLLSYTDFVICRLSYRLCRVIYEMMQYIHADAAFSFHSLDKSYFFEDITLYEHVAHRFNMARNNTKEISLIPGDTIRFVQNYGKGYSKGKNMRTGIVGYYPSYKAHQRIQVSSLPTYSHVGLGS